MKGHEKGNFRLIGKFIIKKWIFFVGADILKTISFFFNFQVT